MKKLKQAQREQSELFMEKRASTLDNVLRKNQMLVNSVPEVVVGQGIRKEFLK